MSLSKSNHLKKIAFHGVPRSGTSWVGSIFDSSPNVAYRHQPLFSYAFKSFLNEHSNKYDIDLFFDKILKTEDDFVLRKSEKAEKLIPSFNKTAITHIIYKEARYHNILENLLLKHPYIIVVGIIRNPKSVLSSWFNAPKEFNKEKWNPYNEWRDAKLKNANLPENYYGYNKWKEVAKMILHFKNNYPKRFYLIDYRKLLNNTKEEVSKLFDFCEIPLDIQTINFIDESKSRDISQDAYSVYRKNQQDDKWKEILTQSIINEIDRDLKNTELERFNY